MSEEREQRVLALSSSYRYLEICSSSQILTVMFTLFTGATGR